MMIIATTNTTGMRAFFQHVVGPLVAFVVAVIALLIYLVWFPPTPTTEASRSTYVVIALFFSAYLPVPADLTIRWLLGKPLIWVSGSYLYIYSVLYFPVKISTIQLARVESRRYGGRVETKVMLYRAGGKKPWPLPPSLFLESPAEVAERINRLRQPNNGS